MRPDEYHGLYADVVVEYIRRVGFVVEYDGAAIAEDGIEHRFVAVEHPAAMERYGRPLMAAVSWSFEGTPEQERALTVAVVRRKALATAKAAVRELSDAYKAGPPRG